MMILYINIWALQNMTLTFFLENDFYFLASYIPASKFVSLEHNCHIFRTQLSHLRNKTVTSRGHNHDWLRELCHVISIQTNSDKYGQKEKSFIIRWPPKTPFNSFCNRNYRRKLCFTNCLLLGLGFKLFT